MARVRDVLVDEIPEVLQPVYQRFIDSYGPYENLARVVGHRPPAVKNLLGLMMGLAEEELVSPRYIEIAVVPVSALNGCRYCLAHHAAYLIKHGLPPEAPAAILDDQPPGFDAVDLLVRDYAIQVTRNYANVDDSFFTRLRAHFSEEQIVELTLRTALTSFYNRFNEVMQLQMEAPAIAALAASGATDIPLPDYDLD